MTDILNAGDGNWQAEMDAYELPKGGARGAQSKEQSSLEALQAEMKLLHWHKLANEAALKAALIRTKKMKQIDSKNPPRETLKDKAEWMQQIIEEEQAKPLQVGKDYIIKYEEEEKKNEAALQRQVEHHVNCLKNLRSSIEKRDTIKARKQQFKAFKQEAEAERRAVMEGRVSAANRFKVRTPQEGGEESNENKPKVQGTLSTVIGSLDKLVDLEKRISSLESDNLHDRVKDGATVPQQKLARMKLAFEKKRTMPKPGQVSKPYYSVRIAKKGGQGAGNRQRGIRGTMKGLGRKPRQQNSKAPMSRTMGAGSTFMTQGASASNGRGGRFGNTTGSIARGSGRSAVAARSKPSTLQERRAQAKVNRQNAKVRGQGASAGIKTKNVHMQQFHNIRKQNQMRTDKIRRGQGGKSAKSSTIGATSARSKAAAGRRMGNMAATTGSRMNKPRAGRGRPAGRPVGRPRPKIGGRVGGGYKTTGGASRAAPPPGVRGASRFPAVKGAAGGRAGGNKARSVGGSGLKAVRAKAQRKAW